MLTKTLIAAAEAAGAAASRTDRLTNFNTKPTVPSSRKLTDRHSPERTNTRPEVLRLGTETMAPCDCKFEVRNKMARSRRRCDGGLRIGAAVDSDRKKNPVFLPFLVFSILYHDLTRWLTEACAESFQTG